MEVEVMLGVLILDKDAEGLCRLAFIVGISSYSFDWRRQVAQSLINARLIIDRRTLGRVVYTASRWIFRRMVVGK